ncbi:hypothetical protein Pelo_3991 [Pelomyxa schiedti]|nr:hypothetical protein Pelo_3991 [Pelomyxa schiedti]
MTPVAEGDASTSSTGTPDIPTELKLCVLVVWRVLDGPDAMVQQTVMWDSCPWLSDLQSMEFFCLDGDSHLERSDLLRMFLLQTRGTALFLCLLQIDLSTLGQEDGVITHPEFVVECNLSQLGLSSDNLCRPLINRSAHERQYYMPFTTKKEQSLLELSTGATFTWLEDSTGLEVNAVDESHISTTTSDHSSTSVFALSSLCDPSLYCSTPTEKAHNHNHNHRHHHHSHHHHSDKVSNNFHRIRKLIPGLQIHHPPNTLSVVAGCGMLVSSFLTVTPAELRCQKRVFSHTHSASSTARFGSPFITEPLKKITTVHTFVDALTGAQLFTMSLPEGLLPQSITPSPCKTPRL